jgi:hypothetical protein
MPFVRTLVAIVPAFTCIFRERDEGKTAATNSGNDGGSNRDDHRRIARDRQREREREREGLVSRSRASRRTLNPFLANEHRIKESNYR